MPDTSPLSQIQQQQSPAQAMVPQASGGNPVLADLMQSMLQGSQQRQGYLQQQQEAYNRDMEKYAQMIEQARTPEAQEAPMWGSMAGAAASVPPTWGNLGAMLGKTGEAYGQNRSQQQASDIKNQGDMTKLRQSELRALEAKDQQSAMLRALTGNKGGTTPVIKVVDGKMIKYDPITQKTEVLSGSQDQIKKDLYKIFYSAAIKNEMPDPEGYAMQMTEKALGQFGGTTVKGETNAIPGTKSNVSIDQSALGELTPEDSATAQRLIARINANPESAKNDTATLEKILAKYNAPAATQSLSYMDKPKKEMEKGTAEVTGKALGKEHENLNAAAQSSGQMVSQLDLLGKLYNTPNMPEGELAPQLQQLRSGMKSLGIDVGAETPAADLARAIATKFALHIRTGEGTNLMPGQMSNYEDKLLQQMAPVLSLTNEGRLALIDYMKETAKSNMRISSEANKLADANRGILPSEWRARRERVMKEEMARLAHLNQEIMQRFQGAK